jgi:2',3'-cyclic-nucleotide 2'-phosphodiesterase (5'-nucleotidase family)
MSRVSTITAILLATAVALSAVATYAASCTVTIPPDGRTARIGESTLGDFIADAARAALDADVTLIQAGQLRGDTLPTGELDETCMQMALLYPREPLVLTQIPGSKILEALERSLSSLPQPNPGFLQVSGLTVSYRSNDAAGHRVVSVTVGAEPLNPNKTYAVAMPSSLAKGAMGYSLVFQNLKPKPGSASPSLSEAAVQYVRTHRTVSVTPGQRLQDLSKGK